MSVPPAPPAPSGHPAIDAATTAAGDAAPLPPALDAVVRDTVRRTRLRRSERRAVAAELAAHFRDGLAAGASEGDLAARFGDPALVAPLLRRGAVAKRSALDRGLGRAVRWGGVAVAALIVLYLAAALRLWWMVPTIRFDPIERFNALLPDPNGQPAWPQYRDALRWQKLLEAERRAARGATVVQPGTALLGEPGAEPSIENDATWEEDAQALRDHQQEIALLRDATRLPVLGFRASTRMTPEDMEFFVLQDGPEAVAAVKAAPEPPPLDFPAFQVLLPQLGDMRRAARLLAADARLALHDGDGARAVDDFLAVLATADHVEQGRMFIGQLVGTAIRALAAEQIGRAVAQQAEAFGDQDLARLAAGLASVPDSAFTVDLATERIGFEDVVQRTYSDDGAGDGVLLPMAWDRLEQFTETVQRDGASGSDPLDTALTVAASPAAALLDSGRRAVIESHARLMAAAERESRRDPWDPTALNELTGLEQEYFRPGAPIVLRILGPAVSKAADHRRMGRPRIEAAQLAVALERFRRAHGSWPAALPELVPAFLAAVPRDPFDGATVRYAVRDGVPMVWSIGADRVDNNGDVQRDETGHPHELAARWRPAGNMGGAPRLLPADWVLWEKAPPAEALLPSLSSGP